MDRLSNAQLKAFDEWLFDYRVIDRKIATRKVELQTEKEIDVNVGGTKGNRVSKPTEDTIAKWDEDHKIKSYENFQHSVEKTKSLLDEELSNIFELRWGIGSENTWEEIAYKIHSSRAGTYRKRDRILTIFAQQIGKL